MIDINSVNSTSSLPSVYKTKSNKNQNYGVKLNNSLAVDTVSFSGNTEITPTQKMEIYAEKLLNDNNFKPTQKIYIKADSKYIPFLNVLSELAYKNKAGYITFDIIEPEIEQLKKKYGITENFDYVAKRTADLKEQNAMFLTFDDNNNPYINSQLSSAEIDNIQKEFYTPVPKSIRDNFKLNPKEIFKDALDIKEGQPVRIYAEREHMPFVEQLVEYLYSENKTKLVDLNISRDSKLNMLKYADPEVLVDIPQSTKQAMEEYYEKDVANLCLDGEDPLELDGIDSKRIVKNSQARSEAVNEIWNKLTTNVPWLVYYLPTTKSCLNAYPELKDKPLEALSKAYADANEINRMGELDSHVKTLSLRAEKMNNLLNRGYKTIHYQSFNPDTKLPDGKTDFRITLSPKSVFRAARSEFDKFGHSTICNIPTEEVFTSPQADTAEGVICATMPLSLNGKIVDGIRLTFHQGRVVDVKADKNEDMLKEHIKAHKNADRLGEVALVAGSPIAKTGRLFNSTLLDENAACHLALGNAYADCIDGATDIEDYKSQQKYLEDLKINSSTTHNDFMVGGKNVKISAINDQTGDEITIIDNDEFVI